MLIDDFILICILVGNDFLPHIPNFHIHLNSLSVILKLYIEASKYFITECQFLLDGDKKIVNENLKIFLSALVKYEEEFIDENLKKYDWFYTKSKKYVEDNCK